MTTPATYGTEVTATSYTTIDPNDLSQTASPGDIVQATYSITGLGSNFESIDDLVGINWQPGVISQLQTTLANQNCELIYAQVDPDNNTVFVQFTPISSASSTGVQAAVIGVDDIIIVTVCLLIAAGVIAWFVLDVVPDAIEKISSAVTSNPTSETLVYGGMALLAIAVIAYALRQWRGIKEANEEGD